MAKTRGSGEPVRDDANVGDVVDAINKNTAVEWINLRAEMQAELQEMRALIAAILGLDAMTQVLETGFGTISDELRRIVPPSTATALPEPASRQIDELRASLDRADLSNVGALRIRVADVPFIGEVEDDREGGAR